MYLVDTATSSQAACSRTSRASDASARQLHPANATQQSGSQQGQVQPGRGGPDGSAAPPHSQAEPAELDAKPSRLYTCAPAGDPSTAREPPPGSSGPSAELQPAGGSAGSRELEPVSAALSPADDEPAPQPPQGLPPETSPRQSLDGGAMQPVTRLRRDAASALAVLLEDDDCKSQVRLCSLCKRS